MASAQMLRLPLPHAPAARLPVRHVWQRCRLHAGLPGHGRQHDCLRPQQYGWARRQGCRRSGRRDRCLRACGLRLARRWWSAPPCPRRQLLRYRQQRAQRKSRGWAPLRRQARRRRAPYRRAPSRHRCLRHSGSSSRATLPMQPPPPTPAAGMQALDSTGLTALRSCHHTVRGPADVSRPLSTARRRLSHKEETEPHQQAPTLSAVTFIFGLLQGSQGTRLTLDESWVSAWMA
jgi:hypothetical protein